MKYAFWNNKGGVGKTFLCFAVASEYARANPDRDVVIIDMCPQANASEILLGGNGGGAAVLERLFNRQPVARTIGGYYHQRILNPHSLTGTETDFLIKVDRSNPQAPSNLYLVAGDPSLELQVQTINNIAVQNVPQAAWRNVHSWVIDLQRAATRHLKSCAFFIDCNPSFSSYTEQAILAAERLIVPCTADGSSARAIRNVSQLVYGHGIPPDYRSASFSARAETFAMTLPKVHLIVMNRSTTCAKKPAKAFHKMFEDIRHTVNRQMRDHADSFSSNQDRFVDIPDAHTVAIVASHLGVPVESLRAGPYQLDQMTPTRLNSTSLERYQDSIRRLVDLL